MNKTKMHLDQNMSSMSKILLAIIMAFSIQSLHAQDMHGDEDHDERGPHNGRLFKNDGIQVELAIYESGIPPEYRAWITQNGMPVSDNDVNFSVELTRLGGQVDRFSFSTRDDYLLGDLEVTEPHSFDVKVMAMVKGVSYEWQFESHEGRVSINTTVAEQAGIVSQIAGEQNIHETIRLYGKTQIDPQTISHIRGRYPGLIKKVFVSMGDKVKENDDLVAVESNDSLQTYTIRAPIAGTVIQRHANPGEVTADRPLLTIANYQQLWVELDVFPSQAQFIRPGQSIQLRAGNRQQHSVLSHLTPTENTGPSITARVALANPDLIWTPGLMVEALATVSKATVPLAVDNRALQQFRDWTVVFIQVGDTYEIRPLELGRADENFTEVLSGLKPGDRYVVENSYLIKADIEKSGASHDH